MGVRLLSGHFVSGAAGMSVLLSQKGTNSVPFSVCATDGNTKKMRDRPASCLTESPIMYKKLL